MPGYQAWIAAGRPEKREARVRVVCAACDARASAVAWVYRLHDGSLLWRTEVPLRPDPPHYGAPLNNPKAVLRHEDRFETEAEWPTELVIDCRDHGKRAVPTGDLRVGMGRPGRRAFVIRA